MWFPYLFIENLGDMLCPHERQIHHHPTAEDMRIYTFNFNTNNTIYKALAQVTRWHTHSLSTVISPKGNQTIINLFRLWSLLKRKAWGAYVPYVPSIHIDRNNTPDCPHLEETDQSRSEPSKHLINLNKLVIRFKGDWVIIRPTLIKSPWRKL